MNKGAGAPDQGQQAAERSRRSVLMIAFHFPPILGSSGVQRTLRFAQHLPGFGWRPIVLTIADSAYEARGPAAGNEVPADLEVHRALGFDAARQLSVMGRYPRLLATTGPLGVMALPWGPKSRPPHSAIRRRCNLVDVSHRHGPWYRAGGCAPNRSAVGGRVP